MQSMHCHLGTIQNTLHLLKKLRLRCLTQCILQHFTSDFALYSGVLHMPLLYCIITAEGTPLSRGIIKLFDDINFLFSFTRKISPLKVYCRTFSRGFVIIIYIYWLNIHSSFGYRVSIRLHVSLSIPSNPPASSLAFSLLIPSHLQSNFLFFLSFSPSCDHPIKKEHLVSSYFCVFHV